MAKKLKDWFDVDCARRLAAAVAPHHRKFDGIAFAHEVEQGVTELELKDRVLLMATALRARLPAEYSRAARILHRSLGPPLSGETGMFTEGYWLMPVARLVEEFGCEYPDISLPLAAEITRRHTAEYAVRPYIVAAHDQTFTYLHEWVRSEDLHIRRLASEGVRPRLPWAPRLRCFIEDPEPILALIEPLKSDPSAYVRKSVANLINDVSKDHPERIRQLEREWRHRNASPETLWILQHGLRTLNKAR